MVHLYDALAQVFMGLSVCKKSVYACALSVGSTNASYSGPLLKLTAFKMPESLS